MNPMFQDMLKEPVTPAPPKGGLVSKIKDSYKKAEGLGDLVADAIHSVTGKEPCDECIKRKDTLNKLIPKPKWLPFHKRNK